MHVTVPCLENFLGVMGERAWHYWLIRGRTRPQICATDAWHNIIEDELVWKGAEILMHVHMYAHIPGILPHLRASSEQWVKQGPSEPLDQANGERIPKAECQSRALQGLQNKRRAPNLLAFTPLLIGIATGRHCHRVGSNGVSETQWKPQHTHTMQFSSIHMQIDSSVFVQPPVLRCCSSHYTFSSSLLKNYLRMGKNLCVTRTRL